MADMPWKEAIIEVLQKSGTAMHYADIAERVVELGFRQEIGATPARTVNYTMSVSIVKDGKSSPFIRVGRGDYFLREAETSAPTAPTQGESTAEDENESIGVHAFGMYWQRSSVYWKKNAKLLGRQQVGADPVDFAGQRGVYLLYDGRKVVYVGRSIDRPLGQRLFEHTLDRLRGRWNRFSWFGTYEVTDDGGLEEPTSSVSPERFIVAMEALLVESTEPPQNRRRGDGFSAIEYLQAEDPELGKREMRSMLMNMLERMGEGSGP